MPRDLADVLHYFLPDPPSEPAPPRAHRRIARRTGPASLRLLAVPIGERDVVRAALTWNLAVEMARIGAPSAVVTPSDAEARGPGPALWPDEGVRPMGADVIRVQAADLTELYRCALEIAATRATTADVRGAAGVVFVRVPPLWLREPGAGTGLLAWSLLLTCPQRRDLIESYGIARLLDRIAPGGRIGVTVHGVRHKGDARQAFSKLSDVATRHLGLSLDSYGLVVDDLDVYQAIVGQRPIGMMRPQSPAGRSLREVTELLLADARIAAHA